MKKKYVLGLCLITALSTASTACQEKETPESEEVLDEKELEEAKQEDSIDINYYSYYVDMWYKDGNMEDTSLYVDGIGHWELYDATGLYASGDYAIDTESNNGLLLLDESNETAAYIRVESDDTMSVEVYNEEFMKLPQTSSFSREMVSQ